MSSRTAIGPSNAYKKTAHSQKVIGLELTRLMYKRAEHDRSEFTTIPIETCAYRASSPPCASTDLRVKTINEGAQIYPETVPTARNGSESERQMQNRGRGGQSVWEDRSTPRFCQGLFPRGKMRKSTGRALSCANAL